MSVDITKPKYGIGTILRYKNDIHKHTGTVEIKAGAYFVVTYFGPGVFQPSTGRHSYTMVLCSKSGKTKKYTNGWNQEYVETSKDWEVVSVSN